MSPLGWAVVLVLSSLAGLRLGWEQWRLLRRQEAVRRRLLTWKERIGWDRLEADVRKDNVA